MPRLNRVYISLALMVLAALACTLGATPPPDPAAISTAAAQTVIASLTGIPPQFTATNVVVQPTYTLVTDTPLSTSTQALTATPAFTFTPLVPQISVSVATNCRSGPGKAYPRVGALATGQVVDVYARDPSGNYWYIRNPSEKNDFCWVWDEYATMSGAIASVPIFTPPPTPTFTLTVTPSITPTATSTEPPGAKFDVKFKGMDTCKSKKQWWVEFAVKNTGKYAFRSISIVVQDIKKNVTESRATNGFSSMNGCNPTTVFDELPVDKSVVVNSHSFPFNLKNHDLRAWIIVCVKDNQGGVCVQRALKFKP